MRAPQFGHTKRKRRANNAQLPAECGQTGKVAADGFAHVNTGFGKLVGRGAKARYASAAPMALYHPPQSRVRYVEQKHVQVTLHLWHKSAMKGGKLIPALQGPIITKKRSTVVKVSHSIP